MRRLSGRGHEEESAGASVVTLDAAATLHPHADLETGDDRGARGVTELGRYVVLRTLGAGAMGTVYLAYDPELDRKVALKLMQGGSSPARRRALLMEAQAMAKLTHPNVVSVHDVGEHDDAVYVAMELVEGVTLRRWLDDERRRWRDVLDVFIEAGRGLEAAHGRGLIHRDFKPDNVMVSDAGRALVMDFGLARPTRESAKQDVDIELISQSVLTEATVGRVSGTPAYMAPEQAVASELTPAADQFAFCVSLWEGVCGQRPFEGETYAEFLANIAKGRVRTPPADRRVPRWLKRALLRGLRAPADERWSSMSDLLAALERGRGRWRWQVGAAIVALVAVPAVLVAKQRQAVEAEREERLAACDAQGATIFDTWNDDARQRLRTGLLATEASFAEDSVQTVVPWLDAYAQAWRAGRTRVCLHATVERDWDSERADRSAWCFEDRLLQFEATVDQISQGDIKAARRAVRLASYLDPSEACLDADVLERLPAPPPEIRDTIRSIRAQLIASDRLRHQGVPAKGLEEAREAVQRAEALGWPPLRASARFAEGRSLFEMGRFGEADVVLTNAYFEAEDAGSTQVAFRAARTLIRTNSRLERHREAKVWARHADGISARREDLGGLDEAEGHFLMIEVHRGLGDYEAAARAGEMALELRARSLGKDHPITAAALRDLAQVYLEQERPEDALEMIRRAYAIWVDAVGREHPHVAQLAGLRGRALQAQGKVDEAIAAFEEAVSTYEALQADDHPNIGWISGGLAKAYALLGRVDDADRELQRSMSIRLERFGARHRNYASGLLDASIVARIGGRSDEALERNGRAIKVLEAALDPQHPRLAAAREALADLHLERGSPSVAVAHRLEALAEREAGRGRDAPELVTPLVGLGDAQRAAGRNDAARRSYERAVAIAEGTSDATAQVLALSGLADLELAEGHGYAALPLARQAAALATDKGVGPSRSSRAFFALARALDATGSKGDTQEPAARAREGYAAMHDADALARVDAWLAEHSPSE